jgi:ATP-dependent Lon protease
VRAAYDAGIREVLLPADNLKEAQGLPRAVLESVHLTAVVRIDQVLARSLLPPGGSQAV